ncbi:MULTISPECIES: PH domain-containing protein [Actinoalloteichus]|uniref:Bacterial PH domain n=1 Tax=Actinoalloteichus fjordicus TaxID=1612552 RepID=A0AAC9PTZ8_9PSEU|nr:MULTISPECIES: PH domain-containing protein [Actinoalloteichus]APU17194.1 Bacterial PH domain [Actinoalloteichus fjordicus]APU23277.1 Bacterial PH domain [Actinoalloteichus sp. GBA129-24]
MSDTTARQAPDQQQRELFRISPIALFGAAALAWCATPFAFGAPGLQLVYLLPIGLAWWVIRRRTTVDATGIQVRDVFGGARVDWSQVRGLRLAKNSTVHVVREEGGEVRLPTVRPRDLPRLAALSGGRLPDPTAGEASAAEPTGPEAAAPGTTAPETTAPAADRPETAVPEAEAEAAPEGQASAPEATGPDSPAAPTTEQATAEQAPEQAAAEQPAREQTAQRTE